MTRSSRPPGYEMPAAFSRHCAGCGHEPRTVTDVEDLETLWLVPGLGGTPAPARYCNACRPTGPITDHACEMCGDGPLLAGELADARDLITSAAITTWLAESGWRGAGRWCPDCAPLMAGTTDRRVRGAREQA